MVTNVNELTTVPTEPLKSVFSWFQIPWNQTLKSRCLGIVIDCLLLPEALKKGFIPPLLVVALFEEMGVKRSTLDDLYRCLELPQYKAAVNAHTELRNAHTHYISDVHDFWHTNGGARYICMPRNSCHAYVLKRGIRNERFPDLQELSFYRVGNGDAFLEYLNTLGPDVLPQLTKLRMHNCSVSTAGVVHIADCRFLVSGELHHSSRCTFSGLRILELPTNNLDDQSIQLLCASRSLMCLEELNVARNHFSDDIFAKLAASSNFHNLRKINFGYSTIRLLSFKKFVNSTAFPSLLKINFNGITFSAAAMEALSNASGLKSVECLWFAGCHINDDTFFHLAQSTAFPNLRKLRLWDNDLAGEQNEEIRSRGIEYLVNSVSLRTRLENLDIGANSIWTPEIIMLSNSLPFFNLRKLDLSLNDLDSTGMERLAQTNAFPKLEYLDLSHCNIQDAGILALYKRNSFPALRHLNLCANSISWNIDALGEHQEGFQGLQILDVSANPFRNSIIFCTHLPSLRHIIYSGKMDPETETVRPKDDELELFCRNRPDVFVHFDW